MYQVACIHDIKDGGFVQICVYDGFGYMSYVTSIYYIVTNSMMIAPTIEAKICMSEKVVILGYESM